ncbi:MULTISPECIES: EAL and HDOD domain-containing protein [Herbaspirillum]|uniref:EAL and HDOD domain-containing protein n=2 Tax=Pseudomonadota TaxID=1224 RepID=UPI000C098BF8|nr:MULTISPECIES: HDOD domain-containing protein [Herbaspirillum]MAF03136.1 EAL domain-containing protein [Herbaspirillum sp.]MBO17450.1 EAL domain-containing protein [Herbaspirillum sp.]MCP3655136.1 EAL domain-containing protein [Herbaspirillum sp.]MCP3945685.1 EAL domain-containing protein [Herbaspirillum sp.]MCP4032001.1 EAL domain-containing protein [Herbaspirillum sp.]|tara:strand:- start:127 stop:1488 length:1362 start_codon:yes stop_codon:yes gene_type:complete
MSDQSADPTASTLPAHQALDFFLARQPILSREQDLIGYELLFRSAAFGPANVKDDVTATAAVIAHASELGLSNVIGNLHGFINVDAAVLMSDFIYFLPADKVVLEILETVRVTPELVTRVRELVAAGYVFALDDVVAESQEIEELLPLVKIIKIDVMEVDPSKLLKLSVHFKRAQKELLAEKVESLQVFNDCMTFGFDYFQGYYFAKPMILQGKKLEASKMIIMHLLTLLVRNVDNAEIVRYIKRDVALSLTLLRLVNTPVYGFQKFIDSLGQALIVLGRRQLKRWLQILLFANTDKDRAHSMSPLMILAATRGKMLELITAKIRPGRRKMSEMAFTVGIMSLVDALFGMSMETVLRQITVSTEIREALLRRTGFYGTVLRLVECTELREPDQAEMQRLLEELQLSSDDFFAAEKQAFEWGNSIANNNIGQQATMQMSPPPEGYIDDDEDDDD